MERLLVRLIRNFFSTAVGGAASGAEWASGAALMRIMLVLQTNLEDKASKYKSQPLAHCFMMNNTHYLVQVARRCKSWWREEGVAGARVRR